jgi:glutamate racemase
MGLKIGIFDSGLGGLTVLRELLNVSQGVEYYYLGDTARVPYGIRSKRTVIKYSLQCAQFLNKFEIDLLIVACNTASAHALETIKKNYPHLRVEGVILPAALEVANLKPSRVGIIGTPSTIGSGIYKKLIGRFLPNSKILQKATPLLVPLVEEGLNETPLAQEVLKHYLLEWENQIDLLVLGCTHYPLLEENIKRLFPRWEIVNSARPLAKALKPFLENKVNKPNKINLFFTDQSAFLESFLTHIGIRGEIERIEILRWEE